MEFLDEVRSREVKVSVIGLGYVGLPLAVAVAGSDYNTTGIDIDQKTLAGLEEPSGQVNGIEGEQIKKLLDPGKLELSGDYSAAEDSGVLLVTVPTPLDEFREPDMSYVRRSLRGISPFINKGDMVILESTLYPRATEDEVAPLLEDETDLVPGEDFHLVFSPERVDPGNKNYGLQNVPKVVGGVSKEGTKLAKEFYETVLDSEVYTVSSPRVAEMEKLLENIYRNVNIALVNELANLCEEMDIDIWETIEAASTKPYGFQPFYPGPGVGGHCIPVDPFFVSWKAREYGADARFIELAGRINRNRPGYVAKRVSEALNEAEKSLQSSSVLVLGVAYKKNISDVRNSPALEIIRELRHRGADVSYSDPHVDRLGLENGQVLESRELEQELLRKVDVVVIVTDHTDFDYKFIVEEASLVLDTRNATGDISGEVENVARI